jgi:hypothetical protein
MLPNGFAQIMPFLSDYLCRLGIFCAKPYQTLTPLSPVAFIENKKSCNWIKW